MTRLKNITIIALLALLSSCAIEVEDGPFDSSDEEEAVQHDTQEESEEGQQSVDPDLDIALEPDEQLVCPDKWCANPGYFVDCACSTESPHEGTTICCNNPLHDRLMVGGSCPAGKTEFSCRRDKPESEDPLFVPPTSCTNGFDFVCPGGYSAKPTDPAESGCVGVTVNQECVGGGAQSCASVC